jgi:hypothetical protein
LVFVFGVLEWWRGAAAPLASALGEVVAPRLVGVLGEAPPHPSLDAGLLRWSAFFVVHTPPATAIAKGWRED